MATTEINFDDLLSDADEALYTAKHDGRGCLRLHDRSAKQENVISAEALR